MKLKTMTINASSHSYLRPSLSSSSSSSSTSSSSSSSTSSPLASASSPRSFLVKKYLKQKYDADFKLQQSLKAEAESAAAIATAAAAADATAAVTASVAEENDDEQRSGDNKHRRYKANHHHPSQYRLHSSHGHSRDADQVRDIQFGHCHRINSSNSSSINSSGRDNLDNHTMGDDGNDFSGAPSSSPLSSSSSSSSLSPTASTLSSASATAPFTPSYPQPVAVMLSNGYIIDVTSLERPLTANREMLLHQERPESADHVTARTPGLTHDSASAENLHQHVYHSQEELQPARRSSVIVSNSNHPANRRLPLDADPAHFLHRTYAAGRPPSNGERDDAEMPVLSRYVSSPNHSHLSRGYGLMEDGEGCADMRHDGSQVLPQHPRYQFAAVRSERRPSASSTPTPPPAHMPSPPPAHTPITSLLPRHTAHHALSPAPAHTSSPASYRVASMPSPAHQSQTPPPAHSSPAVPANFLLDHRHRRTPSPAYQLSPAQPSTVSAPAADVLPADHPIHHPLVQQLISQRLHVPERPVSSSGHDQNATNNNDSIPHISHSHHHKLNPHSIEYYSAEDEMTPISPPHQDSDVIYNYDPQTYHTSVRHDGSICASNVDDNVNDNSQRDRFFQLTQGDASEESKVFSTSRPNGYPDDVQAMACTVNYSISSHMPPSPSPSLPSTSPTHASFQSPAPAGSLSISQEHEQVPRGDDSASSPGTNGSTTYTYEAFLVSDGRSRKRSHSSVSSEASCNSASSVTTANGRPRYTCGECGKDYATSSNLSRHKQTHRSLDSKNAKKCPHCDKVYVSMPALSMHILTHDLKHPCTVCGKTFSRPWLLQGHMRSHTGEKPFGCAHCGKAFADRSNLRAHMQTHSAFKHFSCGKCNKTFALKSYLNKHLESACVKD